MMRRIAFFLFLLLKSYNAGRVFTFLRSDTALPGPSMLFDKSLAKGVFEFQFKTFVERALMLYQDDNGITDHIQITFQNGRLWFLFLASESSGSPPATEGRFTSEKKYNDFEWHTVRIERNTSVTSFIIDNGKERKSFETFGYQSVFKTNLLIGGFRADQYINDLSNQGAFGLYVGTFPFRKRGFFNACVRNVKYASAPGSPTSDISNKYIEKNKVEEGEKCKLNYCNKPDPICKNNGRCKPVKGTKNVTCECLWTGFEGRRCTERALKLTLNGTYKVRYHFRTSRAHLEDKYTFRLRTRQPNAVLFFARGPPNHSDLTLIEIKSSHLRIVVNLGARGTNYTLTSNKKISDGRWHFIEYKKTEKPDEYVLKVDTTRSTLKIDYSIYMKMDYDKDSYLGEISEAPYKSIEIEDFVWMEGTNFVTGLFESYQSHNRGLGTYFAVLPNRVLPNFNRKLPSFTPKPLPKTNPTTTFQCNDGPCVRKGSVEATDKPKTPNSQARSKGDDDDDSSVTWIVVVAVIFSLLLFAAIAFFVYKWNQRFSGDFQVNRKPIGPAGTVVHYQDAGHKEKQRQMKL